MIGNGPRTVYTVHVQHVISFNRHGKCVTIRHIYIYISFIQILNGQKKKTFIDIDLFDDILNTYNRILVLSSLFGIFVVNFISVAQLLRFILL